ncbi:MBL fold metallo-hydrolase [Corallincola spongiicola]|uniref:MBL fold metallo-hydrolase n=1 Tax=Corallincola spongiicola TaxID=2520508 RepID=A0ABY1WRB8_9GAMM|nr:MBL fold metallo-hydrolase [Corallincola spongiicola]TAA47275.1 MBL fold metallo-hydrolase [Corallincola spongiicola]
MRSTHLTFFAIALGLIVAGCSSPPKLDARIELTADQGNSAQALLPDSIVPLLEKDWAHGVQSCSVTPDNAVDVYQHSATSYILRVSKCISFEAPFIYLLIGDDKVLLVDTGPTDDAAVLPLYQIVNELVLAQTGGESRQWLVVHSHSHSDHYNGDALLQGQANITLVSPKADLMNEYFGFDRGAQGQANIELGNRSLSVLPIPGHQEESIALYDPETQWLITGDTLYPGLIYVKHWQDYRDSVHRLYQFTQTHPVSAVLGAHIEMTTTPGLYYPIGTLYQPNELPLPLSVQDLALLDKQLQSTAQPSEITFDRFVVMPMTELQIQLSNSARLLSQ